MSHEIGALLVFGILATLLLKMGWRRGFFALPEGAWNCPLRFFHLLGAFSIYFLVSFGGTLLVLAFFKNAIQNNYIGYSSWFNFSMSSLICLLLFVYLRQLPETVRANILLQKQDTPHAFKEDLHQAIYAWILSFPLVLFVSQTLEWLISTLFHIQTLPDQIAVRFLKNTFEHPLYFLLAILSITILAPLIEETLFRGFLQSFIRQHLGRKQAIAITSVCFSLFHYSTGQGLANLAIIPPLFILSLFLGFIYEKRRCLAAPMALHALFNSVSVVNLYLFGGFDAGL